jgi:hypothetical protein
MTEFVMANVKLVLADGVIEVDRPRHDAIEARPREQLGLQ